MPTLSARDDARRPPLRLLVGLVLLYMLSAAPDPWAASPAISGLHVQGN